MGPLEHSGHYWDEIVHKSLIRWSHPTYISAPNVENVTVREIMTKYNLLNSIHTHLDKNI